MSEENMGTEDPSGSGDAAVDPIKNLKTELLRKNENLNSELSMIKQQLADMNQNMVNSRQPIQPTVPAEDVDPILDPKGYAEKIKRELRVEMEQSNQLNNHRNNLLSSLVQQFPELANNNSELTKASIQVYQSLSEQEKNMPNAYKLAVTSAAADLGILAMSKRKTSSDNNDDFTANNSRGSGENTRSKKSEDLDDRTLAFAELLGRPVNDKAYIETLKKTANRKKWSKWS